MRRALSYAAVLVVALSALVVFGPGPQAFACSCVQADVAAQAERADAVFIGEVRDVDDPGKLDGIRSSGRGVEHTVAVARVFQGDVGAEVVVTAPAEGPSCGFDGALAEGREVAFFAQHVAGDDWSTDSCSGTALLDADVEAGLVAELGAGRDLTDSGGPSAGDEAAEEHAPLVPVWSEILLGVALLGGVLLAAAAAVALGVFIRRQRRS